MSRWYKVCLVISFIEFILFPLLTEWADALGFEAILILLAAIIHCIFVFPGYFLVMGIIAGQEIKKEWSLPVVSAAMLVVGQIVIYQTEIGLIAKMIGVYLVISFASMLITWQIKKRKQEA